MAKKFKRYKIIDKTTRATIEHHEYYNDAVKSLKFNGYENAMIVNAN